MNRSLSSSVRVLVAACVFGGGVLAAGAFSTPLPAAPEQCLPVVGCVTTAVPSLPVPTVTAPTLPTVPTTITTTAATTPASSPAPANAAMTATTGAQPHPAGSAAPQTALRATATVRVRGQRARRVVEISLQLSKPARVSALLSRNGRPIARRQFEARAGSNVLVFTVGRAPKAGPARLSLTYRSSSGETARAHYRLRLPR
jgi:hypothetical protein